MTAGETFKRLLLLVQVITCQKQTIENGAFNPLPAVARLETALELAVGARRSKRLSGPASCP